MPTGMEIYDSTGLLQISTEFLSYHCRKTGTKATEARGLFGNTTPSVLKIPDTFNNPIIALQSTHTAAFIGAAPGGDYVFGVNAPIGTNLQYYVFDTTESLPASTGPFETRNAAGLITFSAAYYPMLALASMLSPSGGPLTYSGRSIAIAPMAMGSHRVAGDWICYDGVPTPWDEVSECSDVGYQNDGKLHGGFVDLGGTRANAGEVSYDDVEAHRGDWTSYEPPPPDYSWEPTMLVIDVTNIPTSTTFW